jgi:hypothetical protein
LDFNGFGTKGVLFILYVVIITHCGHSPLVMLYGIPEI